MKATSNVAVNTDERQTQDLTTYDSGLTSAQKQLLTNEPSAALDSINKVDSSDAIRRSGARLVVIWVTHH